MADDIVLNKAAIVERCLRRIDEEYRGHEAELRANLSRQDAIVLNLQRACQACIDLAMHLVRRHRLGLPQESRDAFQLLADAGLIDEQSNVAMQAMVGFRNVAVHDYRKLDLEIVRIILEERLDSLREFTRRGIELS